MPGSWNQIVSWLKQIESFYVQDVSDVQRLHPDDPGRLLLTLISGSRERERDHRDEEWAKRSCPFHRPFSISCAVGSQRRADDLLVVAGVNVPVGVGRM